MSFTTTYMDMELIADTKNKHFEFTLELRILEVLKDTLSMLFVGPQLRKQVEPGKYEEVSRLPNELSFKHF